MEESRSEPRFIKSGQFGLSWKGRDGETYSTEGRAVNMSTSGIGIECSRELREGSIIRVQARDGSVDEECEVVHCTRRGQNYLIGFEFREDMKHNEEAPEQPAAPERELDHYEALQISRKADLETIRRVYRIMAVRFHPDNPETGSLEKFLRMKQAFEVLSDRERRAAYDAKLDEKVDASGPRPIFTLKDFVTGVEAEANRRLGVLSLLYNQRQTAPDHAGVSLLDLEKEMGFPREYLCFTTWYLNARDYIEVADNSDYSITAAGVEYIEKKAGRNELVGRMLFGDTPQARTETRQPKSRASRPKLSDARHYLPSADSVPVGR
jgi:curved DNA-binding protein CbpA